MLFHETTSRGMLCLGDISLTAKLMVLIDCQMCNTEWGCLNDWLISVLESRVFDRVEYNLQLWSWMNIGIEENQSASTTVVPIPTEKSSKTKSSQKMNDEEFSSHGHTDRIDVEHDRYPHCLVWTPIPLLSWLFPFIGHMGIARTDGVIRDFAGPYYVSVRWFDHFNNELGTKLDPFF